MCMPFHITCSKLCTFTELRRERVLLWKLVEALMLTPSLEDPAQVGRYDQEKKIHFQSPILFPLLILEVAFAP